MTCPLRPLPHTWRAATRYLLAVVACRAPADVIARAGGRSHSVWDAPSSGECLYDGACDDHEHGDSFDLLRVDVRADVSALRLDEEAVPPLLRDWKPRRTNLKPPPPRGAHRDRDAVTTTYMTSPPTVTTSTEEAEEHHCSVVQEMVGCCSPLGPRPKWYFESTGGGFWTKTDTYVRWDFQKDLECGGKSSERQRGIATLKFKEPEALNVQFSIQGNAEAYYDQFEMYVDGEPLVTVQASNGWGGSDCEANTCHMCEVHVPERALDMTHGGHNLTIVVDSFDGLYHDGAYFHVAFTSLAEECLGCECIATLAPTYAPTPAGQTCCDLDWGDDRFKKCDYFGEPHFLTSFFQDSEFEHHGTGIFKAAASVGTDFEVQNFQCPFNNSMAAVVLGIAAKIDGTTFVVTETHLYVNGTEVHGLPEGLKVGGTIWSQEGMTLMSSDCCSRINANMKAMSIDPFFYHDALIRILRADAASEGICGKRNHYELVGTSDMLFSPEQLEKLCEECHHKPLHCQPGAVTPTPMPIPQPDVNLVDFCVHASSIGGEHCGLPKAFHDNALTAPQGPTPDLDDQSSTTVFTTTEVFVPEAGAKDDPHMTNLAKEEFAVNQPGNYTLLRVPADTGLLPLLEVGASILPGGESKCGMYIREVALLGEWLGGRTVRVRSLRRDRAGSNIAGSETLWPFAVRVDGDPWVPFGSLGDGGPLAPNRSREINGQLPDAFRISAFRREELGLLQEAQTFEFRVGAPGRQALIHVAQASHQALNVELARAKNLGATRLAGLLGTERHDPRVEALTDGCKAERELRGPRRIQDVLRSRRGSALLALPDREVPFGAAAW